MKYIVQFILRILAKKLILKHNPKIIAVTGSVGKTTTKDAIYHVISGNPDLKVLTNKGNFNNEFGLPLTILEESAGKSWFEWVTVIFRSLVKVFSNRSYYDVLVLEMAADGPGDIVYLTRIAQPNIAVVTNVERVHLLNFRSLDELAHEKSTLVHMTRNDGMVLLNYDNQYTRKMIQIVRNRKLFTFGLDKEADVKGLSIKNTSTGLMFKVVFKGDEVAIKMPYVIGKHNIYTILPCFPIAEYFGLNSSFVSDRLKTFKLPSGRMSLLEGINDSFLIDSTYNAEPASMKAAIATLKDFPEGKRRVAVIGDMLELGPLEEESHREIGNYLRESRIDLVFFVGPKMRWAMDSMESGFSDYQRIHFYYPNSFELSKDIAQKIKKGDVVLVKGSRGMTMERVVNRLRK